MLTAILSVANADQNAAYSPSIYQSQYQTTISLLISALVKEYPSNPQVLDMLDPFIGFSITGVKNGYFNLPEDYRNILGAPYVFINANKNGECKEMPVITTQSQFKTAMLTASCKATPIEIVPESEFSVRTSSTYKYPTHEFPIGYFSGKKQIKMCPYDLSQVALLYVQNELILNAVYQMQPDDTYILLPNDPNYKDSQFGSNAFQPIFNAMMSLYSAYSRDTELRDWSRILHSEGIL
jgi:hypothetical protein